MQILRSCNATTFLESSKTLPRYTQTRYSTLRGFGYTPVSSDFSATHDGTRDLALARFKNKLRSAVGDKNLIVPLVELRELRGTLRSTANMATNLMETLITIKRTRGRSAINYASDAWLNFSFGVKPLVNDAKEICETIETILLKADPSQRIEAGARRDWSSGRKVPGLIGAGNASIETSQDFHHTLTYKYIGGFDLSRQAANDYGVGSQFHLELGALIPAFWELVPYSWVVDYFTTMGAYLDDTFTASPGVSKYICLNRTYTCRLIENTKHIQQKPIVFPGTDLITSQQPGLIDVQYFEFERTSIGALPSRSLRFKSVDEVGQNAINKLLNLASVFNNSVGKRRPPTHYF